MTRSVIGPNAVALHTTWASDVLYAVMGTLMSLCIVVVFIQAGFDLSAVARSAGAAGRRYGPVLTPALILGAIPMFAMWMVGGWLRVLDRAPAMTADTSGMRFHPAFGPRQIPWDLVESVDRRDRKIAVRLRRRIWSPWVWLSGRVVAPYVRELGLSQAQADEAVAAIRALKARADRRGG